MTIWFIILLGIGEPRHPTMMQQPFSSRVECEKSAQFLLDHQSGYANIGAAYCIPQAKK